MRKGQHAAKQIEIRDMVIFIMTKWLVKGVYNPSLMLPELMQHFDKSEATMRAWIKEASASGILPNIQG